MANQKVLRLGTRGSLLARMQSQMVADALEKLHPGLAVELVIVKTTGDRIQDKPLYDAGGKGLFTKELEQALIDGAVDFAVHSFKDVPVAMPLVDASTLVFAAVPKREDPRDVLVSPDVKRIADLPKGAKVGTGSLRRRAQLLALRSDVLPEAIRGNIDTRLRKLSEGQYDAVILAMAGLKRSGLFDETWMTPIPTDQLLPAPAQGALAIQCRNDDSQTKAVLSGLNDVITCMCVETERAVVAALNGDCHSPIAALARIDGTELGLEVAVGARDGRPPVLKANAQGPLDSSQVVVDSVLNRLNALGVQGLLGVSR